MEVPLEPGPARPKTAVVFNLKRHVNGGAEDAEAEYDSMETVEAIRAALATGGFETVAVEADENLQQRLREENIDFVFNIAEGRGGRSREAHVPALLEMLDIPFSGSDAAALGCALDKELTKRLMSTWRVRSPKGAVIENAGDIPRGLRYPVIVKPNAEGSSKGVSDVSIVENRGELKALIEKNAALYGEPMLAEEYIQGREFTVGLLGNGSETRVFPPMEIIFRKNTQGPYRVYSYGVKREYKRFIDYACPPELPEETVRQMCHRALTVFRALGCRDFARVDFRLSEDGTLYFIEVNPLPGLAPEYSDYPMLAGFSGVSYNELVLSVARAALKRCGFRV